MKGQEEYLCVFWRGCTNLFILLVVASDTHKRFEVVKSPNKKHIT